MKGRYHLSVRPTKVEKPNHRHRALLRTHGERPRRGPTEQSDKIPSPHVLTQAEDHTLPHRLMSSTFVHHSKFDCRMSQNYDAGTALSCQVRTHAPQQRHSF